jgi:pyruvate dehydrogenase E2 component (dihydrolipoamide acetyltransferase)
VAEKAGSPPVLPLPLKACAFPFKELPDFNSSLAPSGKAIIRKKYVNIGFAVDTPEGHGTGLKRRAKKSPLQLVAEAATMEKAQQKKALRWMTCRAPVSPFQPGPYIGGTGFTPIVTGGAILQGC